jgi:hypothetical protein
MERNRESKKRERTIPVSSIPLNEFRRLVKCVSRSSNTWLLTRELLSQRTAAACEQESNDREAAKRRYRPSHLSQARSACNAALLESCVRRCGAGCLQSSFFQSPLRQHNHGSDASPSRWGARPSLRYYYDVRSLRIA